MKDNNLKTRPPIVAVMGHIDHGKSTLLDYIRKTNTTDKEAGGITQHISAYEAECDIDNQKRIITFLDTPGHEAFCSIRERSTRIADIAILVVSAEEGVKPQTIEALECIKKDGVPFVVALNKIDRPGANVDKIKQNLAENDVLVEGWGGNIPAVAISAKTGDGVQELLETIILQSDLEELKGNPDSLAEGFVIESNLNPKQGASATLVIKNGSAKIGMFVASAGCFAPIRTIENYKGENILEATFSSPVRIFGWDKQPMAGQPFKTFHKKEDALKFAEEKNAEEKSETQGVTAEHFFEVVIKADTFGSLDAVEHELKKLGSDKMAVKIISKGVGIISENDIRTAGIKKCLVLGFNVDVNKGAEILALRDNIEIKTYKIIYELTDYVKEKIKENTPVEMVEMTVGSAKILRVFSKNKDKQVLGCRVDEGEIKTSSAVKILRRDALIGNGKIKELQIQKIKTDVAKEGQEFGLLVESKIEIAQGDILKVVEMKRQ